MVNVGLDVENLSSFCACGGGACKCIEVYLLNIADNVSHEN